MRKVFLLLLLFIPFVNIFAQDPTYTQFWANPIYLNPAFAGVNNNMRVSMNYRNQWGYIPGGFSTANASIDMKTCNFPNVGLGFLAMQDTEGEGFLNTSQVSGIFNYIIEKPNSWQLSFGLQPSYINKSVDWDRLVFGDQLDPVLGDIYASGNMPPPVLNRGFFDVSAGVLWRFFLPMKTSDDWYCNLGMAVQHVFEPDEALVGSPSPLPRRFTFHGGTIFTVSNMKSSKSVQAFPNFKIELQEFSQQGVLQKNMGAMDLGLHFMREPVIIGFNYHRGLNLNNNNGQSLALIVGLKSVAANAFNYHVSYSYDMNIAGMNRSNIGVHELAINIMLENICFIGTSGRGRNRGNKCFDYQKKGITPLF